MCEENQENSRKSFGNAVNLTLNDSRETVVVEVERHPIVSGSIVSLKLARS